MHGRDKVTASFSVAPEDVRLPGLPVVAALEVQLGARHDAPLAAVAHPRHLPEQAVPAGVQCVRPLHASIKMHLSIACPATSPMVKQPSMHIQTCG